MASLAASYALCGRGKVGRQNERAPGGARRLGHTIGGALDGHDRDHDVHERDQQEQPQPGGSTSAKKPASLLRKGRQRSRLMAAAP